MAVEFGQRNASPMQVVAADGIAVDLNVHDHDIRLLDAADLSQLDAVTESGG